MNSLSIAFFGFVIDFAIRGVSLPIDSVLGEHQCMVRAIYPEQSDKESRFLIMLIPSKWGTTPQ